MNNVSKLIECWFNESIKGSNMVVSFLNKPLLTNTVHRAINNL